MKHPANIMDVADLKPDMMGFILYEGSPRHVSCDTLHELKKLVPENIRKTAVLVNEPLSSALEISRSGLFEYIQLHGDESPEYCSRLAEHIRVIKAFHISERLPEKIHEYESSCEMFLFDTAGKGYGGTGKKFDHKLLEKYTLNKTFILGGGISPGDHELLTSVQNEKLGGIDLNSRFESEPGKKDIKLLKSFIEKIRTDEENSR